MSSDVPPTSPMIATSCEVAIIGGGVAGLAAAHRLKDRSVVLFEATGRIGGRTRVDVVAGQHLSMGAGVVYRGTPTDSLVHELGIETFPVAPDTYSLHYRGVTVVARTLGELVAGLPLQPGERRELLGVLSRIAHEYGSFSGHGLKDTADTLTTMTFADYIGDCSPLVTEILDGLVFAHAMLHADEISAKYVLRYLSSKLVMDAAHAGFIRAGMQEIADRLAAGITASVALGHRVVSVTSDGDGGYDVEYEGPGGRGRARAREVVLAVPGPAVAGIVPGLPEWKTGAIDRVESVAALVVGVTLRGGSQSAWRNVFFVPVLGGVFDYVCTMRVGPDQDPDADNSWQLGMWRDRALTEMGKSDEQIAGEWIDGLEEVFPGAREAVLGWSVARWPAGFAIAKPDRVAVLPQVIRPVEGLHFAGDYASESAGTHGAIEAGTRAAAEARDRLRPT